MTHMGDSGAMTMPQPFAPLEQTLTELLQTRRRMAELVRQKDADLRAARDATGLPKTGPNGLAPCLRGYLEENGWTAQDIEAVGISDQSVRLALERLQPA